MSYVPPHTCSDCHQRPAEGRSTRCAQCAKVNQQATDRFRNRKAASKFENSTAWRNCSHKIRRDNPMCQAIWYGSQCQRPSTVVHHLIDPENAPHLRTDPRNLVALCANCHTPTTGDAGRCDYAPTVSNIMGVTTTYSHGTADQQQPAPGSIAAAMAWMQGR